MAKRVERDEDQWVLTDRGARVSLLQSVQDDGPALSPRLGISKDDAEVFELLSALHSDGWSFQVFVKLKRGHKPEPYDATAKSGPGMNKIAWATGNQKRWQGNYLLALSMAQSHKLPVPAFVTISHYDS